MSDDGDNWKPIDDGRMRYEKSHPWTFDKPSGINLEGGCDCPRNAFGFKTGCEHLGTKRAVYPRQKSWRSGGF